MKTEFGLVWTNSGVLGNEDTNTIQMEETIEWSSEIWVELCVWRDRCFRYVGCGTEYDHPNRFPTTTNQWFGLYQKGFENFSGTCQSCRQWLQLLPCHQWLCHGNKNSFAFSLFYIQFIIFIVIKTVLKFGLSFSSIDINIVVNAEICVFKCVKTHYLSIYGLKKDTMNSFKYCVKKNKYDKKKP